MGIMERFQWPDVHLRHNICYVSISNDHVIVSNDSNTVFGCYGSSK